MSAAVAGRLGFAIVVQVVDVPAVGANPEVEPSDSPRPAAGGRRQMGRRHIIGHAAAAFVGGPGREDVEDAIGPAAPDEGIRGRRFLGQRRGAIVYRLDLDADETHRPPGVAHGDKLPASFELAGSSLLTLPLPYWRSSGGRR